MHQPLASPKSFDSTIDQRIAWFAHVTKITSILPYVNCARTCLLVFCQITHITYTDMRGLQKVFTVTSTRTVGYAVKQEIQKNIDKIFLNTLNRESVGAGHAESKKRKHCTHIMHLHNNKFQISKTSFSDKFVCIVQKQKKINGNPSIHYSACCKTSFGDKFVCIMQEKTHINGTRGLPPLHRCVRTQQRNLFSFYWPSNS